MSSTSLNEIAEAAERAMGDIIEWVPGFSPPSQKRSWRKTFSILSVAVRLLQQKRYSDISMQEIAKGANCAVTAIYARFPDKDALLTAIHIILLELYRPKLDAAYMIENFPSGNIYDVALTFTTLSADFHIENSNFIRAVTIANNSSLHAITKNIVPAYARRLNEIINPIMHVPSKAINSSIEFAIEIVFTVHRNAVLAKPHFDIPKKEVLAQLFVAILKERITATPFLLI